VKNKLELELPSLATLDGFLRVIKEVSAIGTLYIAIEAVGEKEAKNARGFRPLRGIVLTKSATAALLPELGETILEGDWIEVTVQTKDLLQNLDDGVGLLGHPTFRGVAVKSIASQRDAIRAAR